MFKKEDRKALIVVDCQYDFVEGSLACQKSHEAVDALISYINDNPNLEVYYSADWHSPQNESFKEFGGIWPPHCVQNTPGSEIDKNFAKKLKLDQQKPNADTLYLKGQDDKIEEYSAFEATNQAGDVLNKVLPQQVVVGGIASEYCVRETALALDKAGFDVSVLLDGLGYVDLNDHEKNIEDLKQANIKIIE